MLLDNVAIENVFGNDESLENLPSGLPAARKFEVKVCRRGYKTATVQIMQPKPSPVVKRHDDVGEHDLMVRVPFYFADFVKEEDEDEMTDDESDADPVSEELDEFAWMAINYGVDEMPKSKAAEEMEAAQKKLKATRQYVDRLVAMAQEEGREAALTCPKSDYLLPPPSPEPELVVTSYGHEDGDSTSFGWDSYPDDADTEELERMCSEKIVDLNEPFDHWDDFGDSDEEKQEPPPVDDEPEEQPDEEESEVDTSGPYEEDAWVDPDILEEINKLEAMTDLYRPKMRDRSYDSVGGVSDRTESRRDHGRSPSDPTYTRTGNLSWKAMRMMRHQHMRHDWRLCFGPGEDRSSRKNLRSY